MSRSGSKNNKQISLQNRELLQKCEDLIEKVTQKCVLKREDVMLVVCIRLNLPYNLPSFGHLETKELEKIIKELEYML